GCDNSLGIIKLDFDNPYGIYLHDTPQKELFALNNRFFSHGCMRMEKPIEMAKYLLKNNRAALDSIDFENCYKNPKPINIQMTEKVNVIVWYHLIDFDDRSKIIYYRNIYNKPL
ncbi:MAG: L,D-transpeptidase family protein, partial [Sediminibacterium sp.]